MCHYYGLRDVFFQQIRSMKKDTYFIIYQLRITLVITLLIFLGRKKKKEEGGFISQLRR